jgi:hypothetical protein
MLLILKLLLAPILVVGSSMAGRRWGPETAGMLVALPVVAGPILFISYLEHGRQFAGDAAAASLLGLVSLALFAVVFSFLSRTHTWPTTLLTGWLACLMADLVLAAVRLPAPAALCFVVAAIGIATKAMSGLPIQRVRSSRPAVAPPWWDLPARAVATGVLVLALTAAAAQLGPGLMGVLAPFPIGTSVVATFTLIHAGSAAVVATMAGVLRGLGGFAAFCFLAALLAEPLGSVAFAVATAGALSVQLMVQRVRPLGSTVRR